MPYSVYVIRLDETVWKEKAFQAKNPNRRMDKPCFYVGSTAHTPEKRYEQHCQAGRLSNRFVRKYHLCLDLKRTSRHGTFDDRGKAEKTEKAYAEQLRAKGFGIWYGVHAPK